MTPVREYTKKFLLGIADGSINAEQLASRLLVHLSESKVEEFAKEAGYFQYETFDKLIAELEHEGRAGKRWTKDRAAETGPRTRRRRIDLNPEEELNR